MVAVKVFFVLLMSSIPSCFGMLHILFRKNASWPIHSYVRKYVLLGSFSVFNKTQFMCKAYCICIGRRAFWRLKAFFKCPSPLPKTFTESCVFGLPLPTPPHPQIGAIIGGPDLLLFLRQFLCKNKVQYSTTSNFWQKMSNFLKNSFNLTKKVKFFFKTGISSFLVAESTISFNVAFDLRLSV